ncbi:hypothetical protein FOA52_007417 [Chlamydomonas sp. UWO 241]|nr:hypothetical protein FOA52_007417 [Chlamydomonas sp. UWO 241]
MLGQEVPPVMLPENLGGTAAWRSIAEATKLMDAGDWDAFHAPPKGSSPPPAADAPMDK